MEPYEPKLILVPTDFSETAAHALRYASALAEKFGAHLLVIYANPFFPPAEDSVEIAREQLQVQAEENISQGVPFDLRVVAGPPLQAILAQDRDSGANLIVMGTHGRSGVRRLIFGSMTESVMRGATAPVIAVKSFTREKGAVGTILCPVTLTPECGEALRRAAALVGPTAPIILLRATDDVDAHLGMHNLIRLQNWIPRELADRCEMRLTAPDASAEEIVNLAATSGADLIVLGVDSDRTFSELLRGTLAERIVQQSSCPVLTVNSNVAPGVRHLIEAMGSEEMAEEVELNGIELVNS